jgi:ABC-type sugar transport system ATPase subunit
LFSGFSLSCPPGQFLVVIGSNGSGKSTLLNLVAGTLRHSSGHIHLGGRPLHRLRDHQRARWIGRVMQNPLEGTCPGLTVAENLRLAERRNRPARFAAGFLISAFGGIHPNGGDRRRYRELLGELGAVDDDNALTPTGRELARLPLDPRVGRMILAARDLAADLRAADPFRQGGGRMFSKTDRSRFLEALDRMLRAAQAAPPLSQAEQTRGRTGGFLGQ